MQIPWSLLRKGSRAVFVFLYLVVTPAKSQFAIVNDPDGFVNVRQGPVVEDNINDTLENGSIVWCFEAQGNWYPIDYKNEETKGSGYIYNTRVKFISDYAEIPKTEERSDRVVFSNGAIVVKANIKGFTKDKHDIHYTKTEEYTYVDRIDGEAFWGTDGGIPRTVYSSLILHVNGREEDLTLFTKNLFEPSLESMHCYYDKNKDTLYIEALNSDDAGAYVVLWVMKHGKFMHRYAFNPF